MLPLRLQLLQWRRKDFQRPFVVIVVVVVAAAAVVVVVAAAAVVGMLLAAAGASGLTGSAGPFVVAAAAVVAATLRSVQVWRWADHFAATPNSAVALMSTTVKKKCAFKTLQCVLTKLLNTCLIHSSGGNRGIRVFRIIGLSI